MPFSDTKMLAELLDRKCECLGQLRDLGGLQMQLVESGDMPQLLRVLAAKQHLIERLQAIEQVLEPYRAEDPESRRWESEAERQRCVQVSTACQQLLNEIVEQEKQSESRLIHRRDEAAERLQGAHAAHEVRDAYLTQGQAGSGQLDLSSNV